MESTNVSLVIGEGDAGHRLPMLEAVNPGCIIHAQIRGGGECSAMPWRVSRRARCEEGATRFTASHFGLKSCHFTAPLYGVLTCFSAPMITSAANRQSIFKC